LSKTDQELCSMAYELGEKYELECTGCAQSAVAAVFDALGRGSDEVFKAASGLADGIGLTGNGTCGALVGGTLAISWFSGRERKDFQDMMAAMPSYLLAKKLHDQFAEKYGCIRCHDLQEKVAGRTYNLLDPKELEEAMRDGAMRHCAKVVGTAASQAVAIILAAQKQKA